MRIDHAYLFNDSGWAWLFTIDQTGHKLVALNIRAVYQEDGPEDEIIPSYKSPKVRTFRMSKRFHTALEFPLKSLDCYGNTLILSYKSPCGALDLIDKKSGNLLCRIDVKKALKESQELALDSIEHVLLPHLKWSDRRIEEIRRKDHT